MTVYTLKPVADIGVLIIGAPNPIFMENEAAAQALLDGSPPPTAVIRISKTHMLQFSAMALVHDVICTPETRIRYNTDQVFAAKLKDAL